MLAAFHQALPGDLRAFQFSIIYDNMYDKGKNKCGLKLVNGQDMPATFGSLSEYIYQDGKVRPDFKRKTEDLQRSNTQIDLFDWKNTAVERIPALVKQSLAKFNLVIEKVNLITVYVGGSHVLDLPNPSKPFEGHGEIENAFIKILIDAADKYHVRNIIMVADSKGNVIKLHKGEFPIRSSK